MSEQKNYNDMSESEKQKEDWMNSKWRPMMGWMYMVVCVADFVIFPVLWSLVQAIHGGQVSSQWQPITLQGAGLFHIAMGAVLGLAAWGRTQEKMNGANNGGLPMPGMNNGTSPATLPGMNPRPTVPGPVPNVSVPTVNVPPRPTVAPPVARPMPPDMD